jgi:glycosyltransferase involved in cell wall biosynthesis
MSLYNRVGRGTYWRALNFSRSLVKRGHKVTLLEMSNDRRLCFHTRYEDGVRIIESPDLLWGSLRSGWDPWDTLARIGWLRGQEYDLVHVFEARPVAILPAVYLRHRQGTKFVLDWGDWFGRGGSVEERPNPLVRMILRPVETFFEERFRPWADGTTVINTVLQAKAVELGVPLHTILLLRNGSDVESLRPRPRVEARNLAGMPADALVVGYTGSIFHRDAKLMARAFDLIHAAEPRARLLLIGYCNVAVERLVRSPEAVYRTGLLRYDELGHYLAACDLCWLPLCDSGANRGRWPLKLNDYMAVGRPTVATAVGDLTAFLEQHSIGLLARDEPQDLADKVLALLGDPRRREVIGRRARHLAETAFTWDHMTDQLEQFYHKVLEGTWTGQAS